MSNAALKSPDVSRWLPDLGWLRTYDRAWLRGDVVAGVTLAAYLSPVGLGDASLANLPPDAGLYACLFGGRCDHLAGDVNPARVAIARRFARTHPRHVAVLGSRAPSGQRADSRRADLPARVWSRLLQHRSRARHNFGSGLRGKDGAALVVLDLSAAEQIDMHGAHMLGTMAEELRASGNRVQAVEARASVRERLRSEGVDAKLGGINRFRSVADALENVTP